MWIMWLLIAIAFVVGAVVVLITGGVKLFLIYVVVVAILALIAARSF